MENIFGITETDCIDIGGIHISINHAVVYKDNKFYIGYRFEQDNSADIIADLIGAENNRPELIVETFFNDSKGWKILDELHLGLVNGKPRVWSGEWTDKGKNIVQEIEVHDIDYKAVIMQYYIKALYTPEHTLHYQTSKKEYLDKFSMLLDNLKYNIVNKSKLN